MLKKFAGKWAQWFPASQEALGARRSRLYLAVASLVIVVAHGPANVISFPGRPVPVAEVAGKNWHYNLSFPVYNLSALESLIECESQGQNISRVDSNGLISRGILQFNGTSTWNEMEHRFNFYGDPGNPPQAIHMADMMISSGLIGRWTCAHSLGLTK